jgi:serine protease
MKRKIIALLSMVLLLPVLSLATTLRVPSQYADIEDAMEAAVDGDTILVAPGEYHASWHGYNLEKALHILSESGPEVTIIDNWECTSVSCLAPNSFGFYIDSLNGPFTISGFTLMDHWPCQNPPYCTGSGFAIVVHSANGVISNNVFFENHNDAIYINGPSNMVIENNLFYSNVGGIYFSSAESLIVRYNTIVDSRRGINIQNSSCHATVSNNIIVNNSNIGIYSDAPPENVTFECNDVWNNASGNYGGLLTDQTGINGNISEDPLFCGIPGSGNFYLQSGSPCAEGNVPEYCGGLRMGVYPVYCDVGTEEASWGKIKSLYK